MMEHRPYGEFSEAVHVQVEGTRVPLSGTIELTNRCPLECSHCYNNLPMNDHDARRRELTTDEVFKLLDELAEAGCLWILFTGGEILARRDFFDIYEYAKRKGFLITLFTNGILVDERIADRLAAMPPFSIEITLYGATKESYEALTRIPGSFEKCLRGIRLLLDRKLPLGLKTVAVKTNKHEVYDMKAFAESLGVEFKFDSMINPRIDCSASPLETRLDPLDVVELDLRDDVRLAELTRLATTLPALIPPAGQPVTQYGCGGGRNSFAIDPYGNLTICVISHAEGYNIRDGSFVEGWNGVMQQIRERTITRVTKCTQCRLRSMCGMCPATAELENGDPEEPVDFLCHVSHLRAEAFGIQVQPHGDCEYCGERRAEIIEEAQSVKRRAAELPVVPSLVGAPAGCGAACGNCHAR